MEKKLTLIGRQCPLHCFNEPRLLFANVCCQRFLALRSEGDQKTPPVCLVRLSRDKTPLLEKGHKSRQRLRPDMFPCCKFGSSHWAFSIKDPQNAELGQTERFIRSFQPQSSHQINDTAPYGACYLGYVVISLSSMCHKINKL